MTRKGQEFSDMLHDSQSKPTGEAIDPWTVDPFKTHISRGLDPNNVMNMGRSLMP